MAGNTTVYDIQLKYTLDDQASKSLDLLNQKAAAAEQSLGGLADSAKFLAAAFTAERGFELGKKYFIDLNSEMEQMKLSMAMLMSYDMGKPFEMMVPQVDAVVEKWQQFSKTTTLTTAEITDFGKAIVGSAMQAGASISEFEKLTERGAVVMKLLAAGHPGGMQYASMELREALSGNLARRQMANVALLEPVLKRHGLEFAQWGKLMAEERLRLLEEAFNDPHWDAGIEKMKHTMEGVTSTFRDNVEIVGRRIGVDLFVEMKTELDRANEWLNIHQREVGQFATSLSGALTQGFGVVKDTFSFIYEHREALTKIAEVWAISKAGGFGVSAFSGRSTPIGGGIAALASESALEKAVASQARTLATAASTASTMLAGAAQGFMIAKITAMDDFTTSVIAAEGALSKMPGMIGLIATAAEALTIGGGMLGKGLGDWMTQKLSHDADLADLKRALIDQKSHATRTEADAWRVFNRAREMGAVTTEGHLRKEQFELELMRLGEDRGRTLSKMATSADRAIESLTLEERMRRLDHRRIYGPELPPGYDPNAAKRKDQAPRQMNVNINRIEVASDDPDRFVMGFVGKLREIAMNRTQARSQLIGGRL